MTRTSRSRTSNPWFAADRFQLGPARDMSALCTDPRILLQQHSLSPADPAHPPCHNTQGYMNRVTGGTAMTGRRLK